MTRRPWYRPDPCEAVAALALLVAIFLLCGG